jgi:transposase
VTRATSAALGLARKGRVKPPASAAAWLNRGMRTQLEVGLPAAVLVPTSRLRSIVTVIGVDPHKSVHEACALTNTTQQRLRISATPAGYRKLLQWARTFPERTWAVEGAHGLGRHLAQFLLAHGEAVVDVPSFLSARVRELSRGGRRKTDAIDALATARAARDADVLHPVPIEDTDTVIGMLNERRDNLISQRTRTANQLHALLRDLIAGGLDGELTATGATRVLRSVRPDTLVAEQRKLLAYDLLADIRELDRKLADLDQRLESALAEHGTTLTDLGGVGTVLAARVLAHTGPVDRFPTEAHYASYAGVAPVEIASGERTRHRLSRAGNRQLNCALHLIALQQVRHNRQGGRDYYRRKLAAGKNPKEAMRCLKRHIATTLYRRMVADHTRRKAAISAAA